ncbi:unnamed protein product [Linum tenue]|uniref:Uncharacterized protein n=1 Tax=Linum tenue TaxID=586396 RepID=A0AAV0J7J6_9ROSI|nr:unnamed protein product [Linum tenue]
MLTCPPSGPSWQTGSSQSRTPSCLPT